MGKPFIHNYSSKEYKAHVQNWSLTQGYNGLMYIGNGDGVLEFDGTNWRIITINKNKNTAFSMFYTDTKETEDKVYVGSNNEFGYLTPNEKGFLEYKSLSESLDSTLVFGRILKMEQQTVEGKSQTIFYAPTLRKTFIIEDDGKNTKIDTISYTNYQVIFKVEKTAYFWDFNKGLQKIKDKQFATLPANTFYENHIVDFVIKESETSYLMAAREYTLSEDRRISLINRRLYRISASSFENDIPQDISEEYPDFLKLLNDINYTYGIYNDVVHVSPHQIAILDSRSGVYVTDKKGKLQQKITEETGLLSNAIYDIAVTDKGNLFLSMNKGMAHIETASPISFWDKSSGLDGVVEAIHNFKGITYVATHQGLYYLEGDKAKKVTGNTALNTQTWSFTQFTPIAEDGTEEETILLVSDNNGIHQLTDSTAKRVFINRDNVYEFYQSKKNPNRIFLLSGEGLNAVLYQDGKWKTEKYLTNLRDDVRMAVEDKDGNIWLGTFRNGAIKIPYYENPDEVSEDQITYYKEDKGLLSLKNVLVYPFKDDVIFATEKGLYKYDKTNDKMIPAPELEGTTLSDGSRDIFSFIEGENGNLFYAGLQSATGAMGIAKKQKDGSYQLYETPFKKIPEMMVLAHYLAPDGTMWFGGSEGVFRYDPKVDNDYYGARNILIRKVQIGKDSVVYGGFVPKLLQKADETQPISLNEALPYKFNSLTFEFSLPSFGEGQSQYRYRLKGFNEEWSEWTTDTKAIYTNLFEREYTFEVQGKNIYGNVSNIASYSFQVSPPFYRAWYAYILYGLLGVGLIWFTVKWNTRRLEKEKEKLEGIVEQRTAEIQQQKEEIEQQANNVMLANAEINQQKEEIEAQAESLREANLAIVEQNEEVHRQKEEVEKSYKNIQTLSEIGQKITQILNQKDLVKTVYSNVNSLMPAEFFGIGLYNPKLQRIEFAGFIENDEELPFHYDRLEETDSKAVMCFTRQEEIIENDLHTKLAKLQEEKGEIVEAKVGQVPQSLVYLPLVVEKKSVGVITVQSLEKNAYGEQQLTILRTLAAYTSIALDNVAAYQTIEEKNRSITDSIRYANTIQGAVLPHLNEFSKLFAEYFVLYNPKDIVSGDFYWLVEKKGIAYLAVIDCTGHGVPGAFMSMIGHSILTEIINERSKITPAEILEKMNERLVAALHQNQESNSDGMDMCLCAFHLASSENQATVKIEYAGAKRAVYYTLPNADIETLPATRRSIGGKQRVEKPFENTEIQVEKGTTFYLTTDGYVDQNSPNGDKIGTLKFLEIVKEISEKPLVEQHLYLVDYLDNFQKTTEQRDDITIIGIRV